MFGALHVETSYHVWVTLAREYLSKRVSNVPSTAGSRDRPSPFKAACVPRFLGIRRMAGAERAPAVMLISLYVNHPRGNVYVYVLVCDVSPIWCGCFELGSTLFRSSERCT